jgi:PilZ domain
MADTTKERRACERFVIAGATVHFREEGFLFSGKYHEEAFPAVDISRGGLRFLSNFPLKIAARVTLKVMIPGREDPLLLKGRVRWTSTNPGKSYKYQTGVQFAPYGSNRGDNDPATPQDIIALEEKFAKKSV